MDARRNLQQGPINQDFMARRATSYSSAIYEKSGALRNCVGFIYGTVLSIARPKGNMAQRVVYNRHKRRHALKFQAVNSPDGLVLHLHGPVEGR